ncbi:GTP-binding protein HflX [Pseudooceanicola antarcticus]|uniref:GTPase HflX n=1 Tax=Pseudooceanicola antarcticus TaxID=1247613 RepID=A0A285IWQ5_9RHOB|nr:GTPase HflX [Pseudooceanicola antarcticus]SNY52378.1 GTP-binding protein HflX [Pseudooceanicola antarcticus]
MIGHEQAPTRAFVIHPEFKGEEARHAPQYALAEAVSLAHALPGLEVVGDQLVRIATAQPKTLFGKGKVEELQQILKTAEAELVLIDGPVSPKQQQNLEKAWNVKILDRTGLILEIFSDRARTREGVLQVELAALGYQRTRLVRAWTHLERQRGGLGFVGGPGETQIEADRRAIDEQMVRLRRQLEKVVRTRELHRASRAKVPFPIVALVGYTNAGKSTLFNYLTGADVLAKDMLFATLDPTMRRVKLETGAEIILSDTVGFISDLPHQLVAAFRATLEEVLEADLVLHVRDISHPETREQKADVEEILAELGLREEVPVLEVWNKIDLLETDEAERLLTASERDESILPISAITGAGLPALLAEVTRALDSERHAETVLLPFSDGKRRAWAFKEGIVQAERQTEEGFELDVLWTARQSARFRDM